MSVITASNGSRLMASRASALLVTNSATHSGLSGLKLRLSPFSTIGSSSTKSIRFVIMISPGGIDQGKANEKRGPFSEFALKPYLATVFFYDDRVGQRQ